MCLNYILCQTIFNVITFKFILYFIKQTYLSKKEKKKEYGSSLWAQRRMRPLEEDAFIFCRKQLLAC